MRTDTPSSWDERGSLAAMLDYVRATVHFKCEGLSEADARANPLPDSPLMSIAGLVNHVRWVEYFWFQVRFLGEDDHGPWTDDDPDREMRIAVDMPFADVLDEYREQCDRYRELVASTDLEARSVRTIRTGEHVTMRWVLLHLIEETARHNGHIDLLREMADGVRGD